MYIPCPFERVKTMSYEVNDKIQNAGNEIPAECAIASAPSQSAGAEPISPLQTTMLAETPVAVTEATAAPEPPLTAAQIEELRAKAAKADEYWDRLLRQAADLENFKKRAARERQDAIKYANESILEKLISVMDHFDMALAAANNSQSATLDSFKTGITMIYNQLKSVLAEAGMEEIDAANKTFDPNLHEAVSLQESAEAPEGQVLQQLRKGYRLRDRLMRPAMVVVAKKPLAQ
jgi:molecular chaperone GrpE